jgi:hypothetical protein
MSKRVPTLSVAMSAAPIAVFPNFASAMPVADPLAIRNATETHIEMVWGRGFGWGFGAGFLGGAIVGGALAAPYYRYGYGYPNYGGYPYYGGYSYYRPYYGYGSPYYYNDSRGRYWYDRQLCCRF